MAQATKQDYGARHGGAMKLATFEPQDRLLAEYAALRFDYSQVNEEHRRHVQDAAVDIRRRERRAAEDLIVIGQRLVAVKDILGHGEFMKWVDAEFGYSVSSADELMNIARRFDGKFTIIVNLGATVMRLLAAPSVPDEVINAVVRATETEQRPLKVREVKAIRDSHRTRPTPSPAKVVYVEPKENLATAEPIEAEYRVVEPTPVPGMPAELDDAGYRLVQVDSSYWVWEIGEGDEIFRGNWMDSPASAIEDAQTDYIGNLPAGNAPTPDELEAMAAVAAELAEEDQERAQREATRPSAENASEPRALIDPFDAWLNAIPSNLNLREHAAILELAKTTAKHALELQPSLYNAVYGALPTWSHLIREVGKAAGK